MAKILKYNEAKFKVIQFLLNSGLDVSGKLPPEKELVEKLGLGIVPIRHALDELAAMGIIRKVHGVGSFLCRKLKKKECPAVKLGIISVDSVNEIASRVHDSMMERNGTYQLFHVRGVPDKEIIKDLDSCDHFLISGHVNELWTDFVKSLGKPVLQLGTSPNPGEVSHIDYDYVRAFSESMEFLKKQGAKRFALLTVPYEHLSHSRLLADAFLAEGAKQGIRIGTRDIYLPDKAHEFQDMREFAESQISDYDVAYVEFSLLWTFSMSFWNKPHFRVRRPVLLETSGTLTQDFENLSDWGVVKFRNSLYREAVRLLYEAPMTFWENNESSYVAPEYTGPVFTGLH